MPGLGPQEPAREPMSGCTASEDERVESLFSPDFAPPEEVLEACAGLAGLGPFAWGPGFDASGVGRLRWPHAQGSF